MNSLLLKGLNNFKAEDGDDDEDDDDDYGGLFSRKNRKIPNNNSNIYQRNKRI